MVTAQREDKRITRNSSHFKQILNPPILPGTDENEEIINPRNEEVTIPKNTGSNSETTEMPRRSSRIRKAPAYLKDYV